MAGLLFILIMSETMYMYKIVYLLLGIQVMVFMGIISWLNLLLLKIYQGRRYG